MHGIACGLASANTVLNGQLRDARFFEFGDDLVLPLGVCFCGSAAGLVGEVGDDFFQFCEMVDCVDSRVNGCVNSRVDNCVDFDSDFGAVIFYLFFGDCVHVFFRVFVWVLGGFQLFDKS